MNEKEEVVKKPTRGRRKNAPLKLLVVTTRVGYSAAAIEAARSAGGEGAVVIDGRGVGPAEKKFFGLRIEPETEMTLIAVPEELSLKIAKAIYAACPYSSPARGQVMVLPIAHYFM